MKFLVLSIFSFCLFIQSPTTFAQTPKGGNWAGGSLSKISDKCSEQSTTALCIAALLAYRCKQMDPFLIFGNLCSIAAAEVPSVLDISRIKIQLPNEEGGVTEFNPPLIYTEKLLSLIQNKDVQNYLDDLPGLMKKAFLKQEKFNLFQFTLTRAKTTDLAIEWLAVLLQDTSGVKLPVRFLSDRFIPKDPDSSGSIDRDLFRTLLRLEETLDLLEPSNFIRSGAQKFIKLYPESVSDAESINPKLYHFYPMAYLSQRMINGGFGFGPRQSFFLSYLFNADYEFQNISPDRWPLRLPAPLPFNSQTVEKLSDVYTGFKGALFGTKRNSKLNLLTFTKEFSFNPDAQLRRFFLSIPK